MAVVAQNRGKTSGRRVLRFSNTGVVAHITTEVLDRPRSKPRGKLWPNTKFYLVPLRGNMSCLGAKVDALYSPVW